MSEVGAAPNVSDGVLDSIGTADDKGDELIPGDTHSDRPAGMPDTQSAETVAKTSICEITEDTCKEENNLVVQDTQADDSTADTCKEGHSLVVQDAQAENGQDTQADHLACQPAGTLNIGGRPLRISSELPQFSLAVQSNQADLESLSASLDTALEPRELHLQALGVNTDGQPHFATKRTIVSILSEGYAPCRAADPTPGCLRDLFGLDIDLMSVKGQKEGANQDNWSVSQTLFNDSGDARLTIFCVVDGHGPQGHVVSARLCQSLPAKILPRLLCQGDLASIDMGVVMCAAFASAQQDLVRFSSQQQLQFHSSGSTAVIGLRMPFDSKAHIAWVGDVRAATLGNEPPFVSTPHIPVGNEAERVKLAGGDIHDKGPGLDGGPLFRVYRKGETAPGLAISRAFGDFAASEAGVICEPDHEVIADPGSMLMLASDGVWDFFDVAELEGLRGEEDSGKSLPQRIVELSLGRRAGKGIPCDDATCIIWNI